MRTPGHLANSNNYYFDGSGKRLGDGGLETGTIGQQILGALQPLHFGWFGGFAVKVVYAVLGLALTFVTHSGVAIWLARRRDAGRPTPFWETIWAAVTWGQPLAIAAVAIAIFSGGEAFALTAYVGTTVASLIAAPFVGDAGRVTQLLRAMSGIAILAAVTLRGSHWVNRATDPVFSWTAASITVGV